MTLHYSRGESSLQGMTQDDFGPVPPKALRKTRLEGPCLVEATCHALHPQIPCCDAHVAIGTSNQDHCACPLLRGPHLRYGPRYSFTGFILQTTTADFANISFRMSVAPTAA